MSQEQQRRQEPKNVGPDADSRRTVLRDEMLNLRHIGQSNQSRTGKPYNLRKWHRFQGFALQRFQVLDKIGLLLLRQFRAEELIVVIDYVPQRCKAAVMIEAALRVSPEARERRCSIHVRR
jgi:hypothetical protein